jgi:predicted RNA binding protein YcfA (HicA-like mRNA interferase family)
LKNTGICPLKIRELKSLLLQAGFIYKPGKGSHTNSFHPLLPGRVTLSGKDGNDAKAYQEKDVNNALQKLEEIKKAQEEEQE